MILVAYVMCYSLIPRVGQNSSFRSIESANQFLCLHEVPEWSHSLYAEPTGCRRLSNMAAQKAAGYLPMKHENQSQTKLGTNACLGGELVHSPASPARHQWAPRLFSSHISWDQWPEPDPFQISGPIYRYHTPHASSGRDLVPATASMISYKSAGVSHSWGAAWRVVHKLPPPRLILPPP